MNRIRLVPVGDPERRLVEDVRRALTAELRLDCVLDPRRVDPAFASSARSPELPPASWPSASRRSISTFPS
jgi:hypothetical protein